MPASGQAGSHRYQAWSNVPLSPARPVLPNLITATGPGRYWVRAASETTGPRRAPAVAMGMQEPQVTRINRLDLGRRTSMGPGSNPSPHSCRGPAALAAEASGRRGPTSPCTRALPTPTGPNHLDPHRACHPRATSSGQPWYPAGNHGHCHPTVELAVSRSTRMNASCEYA